MKDNNIPETDPKNQIEAINRKREEEITSEKAQTLKIPYLDLRMVGVQYDALTLVDETSARKARLAVIQKKGEEAQVAIENPENPETKKILESLRGKYEIKMVLVSRSSLEKVWEHYPHQETSTKKIAGSIVGSVALTDFKKNIQTKSDLHEALDRIGEKNASEVFGVIMGAALHMTASDIHIEPNDKGAVIRMRLDGILDEVAHVDKHLYGLLLSRIKLLSRLKLNIHDAPQEGRFSILLEKRKVEIRSSILPSEYGEDIALRILDPQSLLSLQELGMRSHLEKKVKERLMVPEGLIMTTGPTGSGKTTTLYAFINFLKTEEIKIITIEDPVEYHIEGIAQTQINLDEEYTFETGLRAILRQDPDIVLISELRDARATEAALHAALAGRRVLTTLHANDASGAIPRLIDMGIDPATIASGISAVIAQRLVRKLCTSCRVESTLGEEKYKKLSLIFKNFSDSAAPTLSPESRLYKARENGCPRCSESGYKGRIGVFEVMVTDKEVREKITNDPSEDELRDFVMKKGMISIQQDALLRVLEGITSIEEVERILGKV